MLTFSHDTPEQAIAEQYPNCEPWELGDMVARTDLDKSQLNKNFSCAIRWALGGGNELWVVNITQDYPGASMRWRCPTEAEQAECKKQTL